MEGKTLLPFISFFGITLPMYGVMIVLGASIGLIVAVYKPVYPDLPRQDITFSAFYAAIGVFVGAKLLYLATLLPLVIRNFQRIKWNLLIANELISGGFVFYGGLIGAVIMIFIYSKKFKLPFLKLTENMIPSVPLIHAVGRIGCFCAGCCYGRPMDPPFGVHFHIDSVAPHDISFFPVQLVESFINLIIFIVVFAYSRKQRRGGQIIGLYLLMYSIARFILEFFRADSIRGAFLGISTSQWISILLLPISIILISGKFGKISNYVQMSLKHEDSDAD